MRHWDLAPIMTQTPKPTWATSRRRRSLVECTIRILVAKTTRFDGFLTSWNLCFTNVFTCFPSPFAVLHVRSDDITYHFAYTK